MNSKVIKAHIKSKELEKAELIAAIKVVSRECGGFSAGAAIIVQRVLSGKVAQCDISIRDHKKLL